MIEVDPTDRVLFLTVPPAQQLAEVAGRLSGGVVVAFADDDKIGSLRRELRDFPNVMILPLPDEDFPWQGASFTVVVDITPSWPYPPRTVAETARVLAPGGRLLLPVSFCAASEMLQPCFVRQPETAAGFQVYRRVG